MAWSVSQFDSTMPFSDVRLHLSRKKDGGIKLPIRYPALFSNATKEELLDNFIDTCHLKQFSASKVKTSDKEDPSEIDVLLALAEQLFVPLFTRDNILFENKHTTLVKQHKFRTSDIGLGTKETFHGSADLRLFGVEVQSTPNHLTIDDDDDDFQSPFPVFHRRSSASSIECEGKILKNHVDQAAAICIISSITHGNIYPGQNSLVPTILINKKSFMVLLYDSIYDILLLSDDIPLVSSSHFFVRESVSILYHVVHHRTFLRKLTDILPSDLIEKYRCGFRDNCSVKTSQFLDKLNSMEVSMNSFKETKEEKKKRDDDGILSKEELQLAENICHFALSYK